MQDIVFYAAANETLGVVRDYANSRNEYAPTLVLGVSVCLRMRLFAGSESTAPYPVTSFSGITSWKWRMDADFDRETPYKLTADSNGISVQTVTDTIDGETLSFTEFAIQISDMNTQELAAWLGTEKKRSGLTGELVGYDSTGKAVFVLQIDDFTVRNRLAGLNEPTSNDQEYLTRSQTENLVSSAAAAKQDKLTSANAGAGIVIDSGGTISMACAILGATNGVKIVNGMVQFDVATAPISGGTFGNVLVDVADGLLVEGGTASIDDASVNDVLIGIEDGTASISDKVVTPGNLHGALSIGQAVDVSCKPYNNSGSIVYINDDFLQGFTATMVSGTTIGFYDTESHKFPKFAKDGNDNPLHYLFLMDVSGSGAITPNGQSAVTLSNTPQRISMEITAADTGYFSAAGAATVSVANWRQYEVNALTEEAKAYLRSATTNPNPDALFRSASVYSVLNKYLVKQDMVSPWIPTISMDDNSDLTVAAGLSYKIKYTNDSEHKITVDTIPADAYGWDAHIQMFIKGTSAVQFKQPLILMDALTPNVGHNLVVKFRNGQALVYVDDLNAGYIVVSATGSTDGTLAYGLTYDPGATYTGDKYIMFAGSLDGTICDFGTVSVAYNTDVIGNGMARTLITGAISVNSGKIVNMQDLTISGSTISSGVVALANAGIVNGVLATGSTVGFSDSNTFSGTNSFLGYITLSNGSVWNGADNAVVDFTGRKNATKLVSWTNNTDEVYINGITFTNNAVSGGIFSRQSLSNQTLHYKNCTFTNCTNGYGILSCVESYPVANPNFTLYIENCAFSDNAGGEMCYQRVGTGHYYVNNGAIPYFNIHQDATAYIELSGDLIYAGAVNQRLTGTYILIKNGASIAYTARTQPLMNASQQLSLEDDVTIVNASYDALTCTGIDQYYRLTGNITIMRDNTNIWDAVDAVFITPVDATAASTIRLTGTTFTSGSLISEPPARIQIPAGTTVSFYGNSNANGTNIIHAPIIVVGNNAAGPGGSAIVVNASGTSSSISGIGSYVAKDGSNDFTAISNVKSVTVSSGASTVASSLASALALTTSSGGINRWVKLANNLTATAVFTDTATVTDKRIITAEYEPVLAGTFSFSGGAVLTVNEASRTTTIASGAMVMSSVEIPSGATVKMNGGSLAIEHVSGDGGTIELAGSNAFQLTSGTIGRMTISSGAIVDLASGIVTGKSIVLYGGASLSPTMIVCGGSSRIFEDVEIHGTTISDHGIICGATVYSNVGDDHYIYSTEDDGETSSSVIVTGATEYVVPGGLVRVVGT